ncbi:MAG: DNA repair protein RecN [Calditrichaeota bacterium]|nr:DNA repair protein RecN [Calditrichota bacterium]MCB9391635.1 DNA repair protein RecN [Calditrichota bacterium]
MLARLHIRDFLLVKTVDLCFEPGFTAITGETGAGKSMILGALQVLFGDTLGEQMIREGAERTILEADFQLADESDLRALIGEEYCDSQSSLLTVRRELTRGGRARGFLQDRPATVELLRHVGERLMDFHGQRDSLSLFRPTRQLEFLDAFAGATALREQLAALHRQRAELLRTRETLQNDVLTRRKEQALLTYQLEEIERLGLKEGEDEHIAARLKKLEQAEKLIASASQIAGLLEQNDTCAVSLVGQAKQLAEEIKRHDDSFAPLAAEAADLAARLRDLGKEVSRYADHIVADPEELDTLRRRAAVLSDLRRKHGVDIAQILEQAGRMKVALAELTKLEQTLSGLDKELAEFDLAFVKLAETLSRKRQSAAPKFAQSVSETLKPLGFATPKFEVKLSAASFDPNEITRHGADQIQFLFSGASGQALLPLTDVASGGESSRVTLAIKSVVAERMHYPLLVYDEIDLGISGRVAAAVASLLFDLGRAQQLVVVTHLPQIAARAEHHLLITKSVQKSATVTNAVMLKPEERAKAVAELLSGTNISGGALAAADDLLNNSNSSQE